MKERSVATLLRTTRVRLRLDEMIEHCGCDRINEEWPCVANYMKITGVPASAAYNYKMKTTGVPICGGTADDEKTGSPTPV
jgi:hypothetical protein